MIFERIKKNKYLFVLKRVRIIINLTSLTPIGRKKKKSGKMSGGSLDLYQKSVPLEDRKIDDQFVSLILRIHQGLNIDKKKIILFDKMPYELWMEKNELQKCDDGSLPLNDSVINRALSLLAKFRTSSMQIQSPQTDPTQICLLNNDKLVYTVAAVLKFDFEAAIRGSTSPDYDGFLTKTFPEKVDDANDLMAWLKFYLRQIVDLYRNYDPKNHPARFADFFGIYFVDEKFVLPFAFFFLPRYRNEINKVMKGKISTHVKLSQFHSQESYREILEEIEKHKQSLPQSSFYSVNCKQVFTYDELFEFAKQGYNLDWSYFESLEYQLHQRVAEHNFKQTHYPPQAIAINGTACVGKSSICQKIIDKVYPGEPFHEKIIKSGKHGGYAGKDVDNLTECSLVHNMTNYSFCHPHLLMDRDPKNNFIWLIIMNLYEHSTVQRLDEAFHLCAQIFFDHFNNEEFLRFERIYNKTVVILDPEPEENRNRQFDRDHGSDRARALHPQYCRFQNMVYFMVSKVFKLLHYPTVLSDKTKSRVPYDQIMIDLISEKMNEHLAFLNAVTCPGDQLEPKDIRCDLETKVKKLLPSHRIAPYLIGNSNVHQVSGRDYNQRTAKYSGAEKYGILK